MTLETKLLYYFYDDKNIDKMIKYLEKGADPCTNDAILFIEAMQNNDIELLKILIKYDPKCTQKKHNIIRFACLNNCIECFEILMEIVDIEDYKQTDTLKYINDLQGLIKLKNKHINELEQLRINHVKDFDESIDRIKHFRRT